MRLLANALVVVLAIAGVALGGCGVKPSTETPAGSGAATAKAGVPDADGNVPFEVFRRAVMAANTGNYAEAGKYILPNSAMGTNIAGKDVMPEKWPSLTHNGAIKGIEFVDDSYNGFTAYVHYQLRYADGSTFKERATFDKVDGRWKIAYMTENTPF